MELHDNSFFKCFSEAGARHLLSYAHKNTYLHPTILFEEGQPSDGIFLVIEGTVRLSKQGKGGAYVDIATVHAGDYFGELGVLDNSPRSARASCYGPTQLAVLPNTPVLETIRQEPGTTAIALFGSVMQHLRDANDRFIEEISKKEKLQTVGEMASKIIHDFKTPIATIQLASNLIAETSTDPKIQKKCGVIQQETFEIVTMVQELLEFAKSESSLKRIPLPISQLLESFRSMNEDLLTKAGVQLNIRPISEPVKMDLHAMLRVLRNLMSNALEVLPEGRGELRVEAFDRGDHIELTFHDNGPGIPMHIRSTLFDPFVTSGKKNGIGLGLAIVKSIIESHEGTISCASSPKGGTTFSILLKK